MIGTLLKAVAYSKAPRTTFTMLHPAKAAQFRKFQWDMRHAPAPRITALGAAALALPVGLWLGRRSVGKNGAEHDDTGWRTLWRGNSADTVRRPFHREGLDSAEAAGPMGLHRTRGGCVETTIEMI